MQSSRCLLNSAKEFMGRPAALWWHDMSEEDQDTRKGSKGQLQSSPSKPEKQNEIPIAEIPRIAVSPRPASEKFATDFFGGLTVV